MSYLEQTENVVKNKKVNSGGQPCLRKKTNVETV